MAKERSETEKKPPDPGQDGPEIGNARGERTKEDIARIEQVLPSRGGAPSKL